MQAKQPNRERIRELRESRGWPQEQLAAVADLSPRTIQRVEAGKGASKATLSAIASAFDCTVQELLETPEPPRPVPKATLFPRLHSGEGICNVVSGAHMYQNEYDPPTTEEEVELIGSFLQEIHDIGEMGDDAEPMHRVRWAHGLDESLREVEAAGFRVFCGRVVRHLPVGESDRIPMSVAVVVVLRADNPKILNPDTEHERLAAVFSDLAPIADIRKNAATH